MKKKQRFKGTHLQAFRPKTAHKQGRGGVCTVPPFRTPAGGRTLDTLIKSQVLYQLSYKRILLVLRLQRYELFLNPANFSETFFKKAIKKALIS